jgi:hypothetical protein
MTAPVRFKVGVEMRPNRLRSSINTPEASNISQHTVPNISKSEPCRDVASVAAVVQCPRSTTTRITTSDLHELTNKWSTVVLSVGTVLFRPPSARPTTSKATASAKRLNHGTTLVSDASLLRAT